MAAGVGRGARRGGLGFEAVLCCAMPSARVPESTLWGLAKRGLANALWGEDPGEPEAGRALDRE